MKVKPDSAKIPLLILAGPTAVGKSAVALNVAQTLNTDIISADSAQVYRGMDIGTAKPTPDEQNKIKHHLIDLVDPDQLFSAADYQRSADETIKQLWSEKKLPFIVGGTGLYIKAVSDHYAFGQKGSDGNLRAAFEEKALREGLDKLYTMLESVDPQAAERIHPNDQRRIIRALEVYELEGRPISDQVSKTANRNSPYEIIFFGLNMGRELLYERIEKRVDAMMSAGFLEEVVNLQKKGYREEDPGLQILGYRQLMEHLRGLITKEDAVAEIKKQTRNLAKRQLTWFRRESRIKWVTLDENSSINIINENICANVKDIKP